ncbi:MAG: superinfection immunity protein [Pseudomonadota bacterium]
MESFNFVGAVGATKLAHLQYIYSLLLIFWVYIVLSLYFLPAIISEQQKHPRRTTIGVLNALFGWTVLGWFITMAWACRGAGQRNLATHWSGTRKTRVLIGEIIEPDRPAAIA